MELLGGGGEVGEDEVGELEDVVAFFEAEGEVGLLAGGEEQAALVFFQAPGDVPGSAPGAATRAKSGLGREKRTLFSF